MNNYYKFFTIIISAMTLCLIFIVSVFDNEHGLKDASEIYNIYLKGDLIGSVTDQEKLYNLIDKKQQTIKDKYGVNRVYPPNELKAVKKYSYNTTLNDINTIYKKIDSLEDFTVKGYEVKIYSEAKNKSFSIFVLDKNVFEDAIKKFVTAFIDEDKYNDYVEGTQSELTDIGVVYQSMYIVEKISIKEKYISTSEHIYTDYEELAQDFLFGFDAKKTTYEVAEGDTITSISDKHQLNVQEFLIANPTYVTENTLLQIGAKVNITLINPELTFAYSVFEVKEVEKDYDKSTIRDNNLPTSYSEITQAGVTGIEKITEKYDVINGERRSGTDIIKNEVIRSKIDQITTLGKEVTKPSYGGGYGGGNKFTTYIDTGGSWGWPTESPYVITSPFAWRWGRNHNGIDISGTGYGSRIHAASAGTVVSVYAGCDSQRFNNACGGGYGNHVIINHGGNLYTIYGHMTRNIKARQGQAVSKGTVIGYMGNSGRSYGVHLHYGASRGYPGSGGASFFDPRKLHR